MKWTWLFDNRQLTILTLGMAGLMAGCCTKSTGGSYSSTAAPVSYPTGGTAETQEATTGQNQSIQLYKEQVNVGTRQVDDGTVRIRKVVKTETVNQPVQLRTESVVIDRQPAGSEADTSQAFQDKEIVIQLHHDEPMIQKQVVPAGQIVATTQSQTEQRNIQEQVRSDSVAIDKGNAQNVTISDKVAQESEPMGGGGEVGGQTSGAGGTITDLTTLTSASDPNSLNGRQVQLSGVTVDRITSKTLVVKDSSGKQCYVQLNQPMSNIQPGSQVNITGTVTQVSPTSDEQIPQGSACIQAQTVQPAQ